MTSTRRPLGIGVVGLGWMGQAHSRSYRRIPQLWPDPPFEPQLVICADADDGRRRWASDGFGFATTTDEWRAVIDHPDVDIVVVTAPNMLHVDIVGAAAAAGKAVFCEKPVGGTPAQAIAAADAVAAAGAIGGVGYNYRWAPMVQHARQLIADGAIGTVTNFRGRFMSCYGADPLGTLSWRYLVDEGGHGVTSDILSHSVDLAHFLIGAEAGPITEVVSLPATFITERPLPGATLRLHDRGAADGPRGTVTNEDWTAMIVRFAGGAAGTFEASRVMHGPESDNGFEVHGTAGSLAWSLERMNELQVSRDDAPSLGYTTVRSNEDVGDHGRFVPGRGNPIGFEDLVAIEDFHFASAVAAGEPFDPGFAAAAAFARVQEAMLRSWESRAWERIE